VVLTLGVTIHDTAELASVYQLTSTQTVSQSVGTDYCLTLEDNVGMSLANSCFDLSFIDPETGETLTTASFVHILEYDPSAARLVLTEMGNELTERMVSANAPYVELLTQMAEKPLMVKLTLAGKLAMPTETISPLLFRTLKITASVGTI